VTLDAGAVRHAHGAAGVLLPVARPDGGRACGGECGRGSGDAVAERPAEGGVRGGESDVSCGSRVDMRIKWLLVGVRDIGLL
jgi:hypothetical protein